MLGREVLPDTPGGQATLNACDDDRPPGLAPPLSPRLRQTQEALLDGMSLKQVAIKLGISIETVKQYAKALHSRYGVSSRSELLTLLLRPPRQR